MQRFTRLLGSPMGRSITPFRTVGKRHVSGLVSPSFHLFAARFAPSALPDFLATTRQSDFSNGISRLSLPSHGLPQRLGPLEISWDKIKRCPAAPGSSTLRTRSDFGRRSSRQPCPVRLAYQSFTGRSVLRFACGFHLTMPHGIAIALGSRLVLITSVEDFHLQSFDHAQRTSSARFARWRRKAAERSDLLVRMFFLSPRR